MTPARFGRALNFASPFGYPTWRRGEEFEFPNALPWAQVFQVDVIVVPITPTFGPPFIDLVSIIETTLNRYSPLITSISMRSRVIDTLERVSRMASSRITRSAKRD